MSTQDEYKGLNLPQLLERMHDLVEPQAVAWTPQTVGWLVVALWLGGVMLLVVLRVALSWHRNRFRRAALAELQAIRSRARGGEAVGEALAGLLKRTALAVYPRREVASLHGAEWAGFLRRSSRDDRVVARAAEELAAAAYRRDVDVAALIEPARRWIKVHRRVKDGHRA